MLIVLPAHLVDFEVSFSTDSGVEGNSGKPA